MTNSKTHRETVAAATQSGPGLNIFRRAFILAFAFLAFAISASASHFRYGLVTATRISETSTTVTYRFNVSLSWRLTTAPGSASFSISGGNSGSFNVTMTNVTDPSGGWTNGTGTSANITLNKTSTPTRITYFNCCKLSTISNNANGNWDVYTVLNTNAPGSTPISTMPAIINMPINASAVTFTVPASDPDAGSTLTFGTPNFTSGNLAGQTQPSGFSLNTTTGTITMNTIGKTVGQQYNAMVTVTDNNGNQIMLDFLINMVGASNPPVFVYSVTPANGTVYNVIAGQTLTFPIRARDDDAGSTVSLSASGLGSAITASNFSPAFPATGNPSNTTFTYTPTSAHVGNSTVLTFIATDNVGVQSNSSVTINVVAEPAPTFISPTPGQGTITSILTGETHLDTIRAQSSLGSNVSIAYATVPSGATLSPSVPTTGANPGQTIMSYNPTASQFGVKNLAFQATISGYSTIYSTRNYQLLVNTRPEFTSSPVTTATPCTTYSYTVTASDANVGYGDTVEIESHGSLPSWLTLTQTGMGTAVLSGNPTSSDIGTHHITLVAADLYHHNYEEVEQEFDIVVTADATAPTISAPSALTVYANSGSCNATGYSLGSATASDNCAIASVTNNDAGTYSVGTHTITWTATDVNSNTATATQTITVVDNQNPTITAPANVTVNANSGACNATGYDLGSATTADNCGVASVTNNDAGTYSVGTHTITWTVTDVNGNTATATQTITVVDNQNPTITAPANVSVNANSGACNATGYDLGSATTADNCGVASVTNNDAGTYSVGTHNITWTVTDVNGNTATATQTITVVDNQNPTITAPANVTVNANSGACNATGYDLGSATTADNCGVASVTNNDAGTYSVGTHNITWTVTDVNGNTATATQTITVVDNQNPTITAPANVTVNANSGACNATGYDLGSATTADNCGVASVTNNDAGTYSVGTHNITWTVTDVNGNTATATQTITVVDNQNPTITAPANVTVNANSGACNATGYDLGSATTADNCGVASVTNNDAGTYSVGTHNITWTVTDVNGNTATATQTITVVDNQNPTITAPANVTVNANSGVCYATGYSLGTPSTADNCGVASVTSNNAGSYAVGTHTITWTVTDVNGNSATATQTITVVDNQNPVASCQNYTLNLSGGSGSITASNVNNGSSDNCGIASMTVSPSTFTCANAGANTVTLTVTDIHGNVSTCNATVTVQYQPSATISVTPSNTTYTGGVATTIYLGYGPQSATLTANGTGGSGFTYSWTPGTRLSCTTCQSPVFTPTAAGTYVYTVTVTNSNGCSTTATKTMCVIDARDASNSNKVILCHVPPGNPSNPQTLSIAMNAVPSHLTNHAGDRLGSCASSCGTSAKEGMPIAAEVVNENNFSMLVYPNPTTSDINIDIESELSNVADIVIYDITGRVVEMQKSQSTGTSIKAGSNLPAGMYILEVRQNEISRKVKITKL